MTADFKLEIEAAAARSRKNNGLLLEQQTSKKSKLTIINCSGRSSHFRKIGTPRAETFTCQPLEIIISPLNAG